MKFELKTDNENFSNSFSYIFGVFSILALITILCNISLKLGIISRNQEINYFCRLLSVEKSPTNFKKLSRLSNLKTKQRIWEFCKSVIK